MTHLILDITTLAAEISAAKSAGADEVIMRETQDDRRFTIEWLRDRVFVKDPTPISDPEGLFIAQTARQMESSRSLTIGAIVVRSVAGGGDRPYAAFAL